MRLSSELLRLGPGALDLTTIDARRASDREPQSIPLPDHFCVCHQQLRPAHPRPAIISEPQNPHPASPHLTTSTQPNMAPFTHPDRLPSSSNHRGDSSEGRRGRGGGAARGRGGGAGRGRGAAVSGQAAGGIPAG